jgi:oxygen-dependent protoporphyrinogen oxidase
MRKDRHVIIVGGGISGLAAAEHLAHTAPETRVTVLEAAERTGGVILSERRGDGWMLELGPDLFLAAKAPALAVCERLGIAGRLHGTGGGARGTYILSRGRLRRMPEGFTGLVPTKLMPFATTPLLSPLGKARCLLDLLVPANRGEGDESVESFVVRRLGREMYERLVEPLLGGIFAGDGARLSIGAAFPQLRAMEREHGGMTRAMLASRRKAATAPKPAAGGAKPTGMVSFPTGLAELVDALERRLERAEPRAPGERSVIRRGAAAARLELVPPGDGAPAARVVLADGSVVEGDAVILATPAHVAAALLAPHDAAIAEALRGIEYASTALIQLGYRAADVPRPLDATGYVVPRADGRPVLACTWSSVKFPHRAPEGHHLFRVFVGGAGREAVLDRPDDGLVAMARAEMREVLGVTAAPVVVRVQRWERAMPQYTIGHLDRVARIEARLASLPTVALAGNAYRGVGIPDCMRSAHLAAERVARFLQERENPERGAPAPAPAGCA